MKKVLMTVMIAGLIGAGCATAQPKAENAINPCNPCAKPMKMKMKNPCSAAKMEKMNPKLVQQPSAVTLAKGDWKAGEKLWNNPKLGTSGASCATCHVGKYAMMQPSFATPYPHHVTMAQEKFGLSKVNAAEMVQLCMVVPMKAKPLDWKGKKLADLTAYVKHIQADYKAPANPCAAKMKMDHSKMANPCNPCAKPMKMKMKNPCNPCSK